MIELISTILTLAWLYHKRSLFRLCVALGILLIDFMGMAGVDLGGMMV